ncbi:hypothetical protein HgNV_068 [Homarus gammarus nudivirus]|uniref:Exonuclease domain-containing protein n=1 Tax=Homarus gammarus nudivirus TaxID=2509616 RepID=A0A411HBC6_9VIRU|nr:hypothetical protein KM727_gp68 [Homarus gammarus nudivirus]QBB28673.1 hypothetical protein HgNV_068 [Homarus gammarus nudivirus]
MGFIFNFHTAKVVKPVVLSAVLDDKFHNPKVFTKNVNVNNINESNVAFFDLEPDYIIGSVEDGTYIPNIREWAILHQNKEYEYKTHTNYTETINEFWKLYQKLNYPYLIAHNGFSFDFLILIAHIYRYLQDPFAKIKNFNIFDSYVFIKPYNIKYSNMDLFLHYKHKYLEYDRLQYNQHEALADVKMLSLWFTYFLKLKFIW